MSVKAYGEGATITSAVTQYRSTAVALGPDGATWIASTAGSRIFIRASRPGSGQTS